MTCFNLDSYTSLVYGNFSIKIIELLLITPDLMQVSKVSETHTLIALLIGEKEKNPFN